MRETLTRLARVLPSLLASLKGVLIGMLSNAFNILSASLAAAGGAGSVRKKEKGIESQQMSKFNTELENAFEKIPHSP